MNDINTENVFLLNLLIYIHNIYWQLIHNFFIFKYNFFRLDYNLTSYPDRFMKYRILWISTYFIIFFVIWHLILNVKLKDFWGFLTCVKPPFKIHFNIARLAKDVSIDFSEACNPMRHTEKSRKLCKMYCNSSIVIFPKKFINIFKCQ